MVLSADIASHNSTKNSKPAPRVSFQLYIFLIRLLCRMMAEGFMSKRTTSVPRFREPSTAEKGQAQADATGWSLHGCLHALRVQDFISYMNRALTDVASRCCSMSISHEPQHVATKPSRALSPSENVLGLDRVCETRRDGAIM